MDVAFAVVPFADVARPTIGLSLLKAGLVRHGFPSKIHYFNIEFAEIIGLELYTRISDLIPSDSMIGEWFFADLVFPGQLPPEHDFIRNVIGAYTPSDALQRIIEGRNRRKDFIERCAQVLKATGAPIIGFTTTFHQTCACLAVAKRLKELPNPPIIVFGGANCEGEMGLQMIRSFEWVDYVCTREGDLVFPCFVERLLRHGDDSELPGLLRRGASTRLTYPELIEDMDSLPIPDYDDYVDTLTASRLRESVKPEMQIEAARGCWWGAKHHCTFCGLNGDTMRYRSKSPARVYEELRYLYKRYGFTRIDSVDNILDHRYIRSVFSRLADEGIELEMFYEVKANLKHSQLLAMRRGGIKMIQPGIESFSNQVLKLMRKGVTGLQNVQLLKWCEEIGITPAWNLLAGFPDESPAEYHEMAKIFPLLTHLEPPTGCSPIRLDRFSPLFVQAESVGLRRVRPTLSYYYVYPFGKRELTQLAYFFDFDYADGRRVESYLSAIHAEIAKWRNARFDQNSSQRPQLEATLQPGGDIHIKDTRECALFAECCLTGLDARLLSACDALQSLQSLNNRFDGEYATAAVNESLNRLKGMKFCIEMDGQILSLPVLRNRPAALLEHSPGDQTGHMSENKTETEPDADRRITTIPNPDSLLRVL